MECWYFLQCDSFPKYRNLVWRPGGHWRPSERANLMPNLKDARPMTGLPMQINLTHVLPMFIERLATDPVYIEIRLHFILCGT